MKLKDLVAGPMIAPLSFQSRAPDSLFGPRGLPVEHSEDIDRVLALPRRPPPEPDTLESRAMTERETAKYVRDRSGLGPCQCAKIDPQRAKSAAEAGGSPCITKLLHVQAWVLRELQMYRGVIAACPVGSGKTNLNILAPLALGLSLAKNERALLLVPANLMKQLLRNYDLLAEHFRVPQAVVMLPGGDKQRKQAGEPVLYVMSHNGISQEHNSDFIERCAPSAIIIDEIDAFCDPNAARTIRLLRYFRELSDEAAEKTRFAGWTGSLTDKNVTEFFHLAVLALRAGSPLPLEQKIAEDWGRCIGAVDNPCPPGALMEFCEPGEHVRHAFQRRIRETRGFVVTGTAEVERMGGKGENVEIDVQVRPIGGIPEIIQTALEMVRAGERPDTLAGNRHNDTFDDPMQQIVCARQVATGMFYRWVFPRREPREVIDAWFNARKAWHSELREKMKLGEKYLDSPKLLERAAMRHWGELPSIEEVEVQQEDGSIRRIQRPRPAWESEHWPLWRELRDTVQPKSEAVRLHPYLVEDAATWAEENRGIVWYSMVEFGQWLREVTGLPLHTGGPGADERIMQEDGSRSIIASMKSHGRGRDGLQLLFSKQLVANMPSSARQVEQLLGRLHRHGQTAECVETWVYTHVDELQKSLDQALNRADYIEGLLGQRQKLTKGWLGNEE